MGKVTTRRDGVSPGEVQASTSVPHAVSSLSCVPFLLRSLWWGVAPKVPAKSQTSHSRWLQKQES